MSESCFSTEPRRVAPARREDEIRAAARMHLPWPSFWTPGLALATPRTRLRRRLGRESAGCRIPYPFQGNQVPARAHTPDARGTNAAPPLRCPGLRRQMRPLAFRQHSGSPAFPYTGTNVGLERIVQAASDLLSEYQKQGYPSANISIAQELITNGIVTMHVYRGAFPGLDFRQALLHGPQRWSCVVTCGGHASRHQGPGCR